MGTINTQFICAFGSDDGKYFSENHFGDAEIYLLYAISNDSIKYIGKIDNTSIKVEGHAVPEKAESVTSLMEKKGVRVVVSRIFGPNIKRIKSHFVPVIVKKQRNIQEALTIVRENLYAIQREWEQDNGERKHLIL